ncbi:Bromodomain and WD repeat-containing protein 1 [Chionoecetes opilio]|uniref:Bromodomain and WD repeat-containing protein 1 n=1 Tax=Chionoecetes opilio TaxID=41210 RepID=A0A8J4XUQ9_CHIOP|nr:Bromodomain and WD repeat-containing protein 1 [Chionoecetes opilio]
MALEALHEEAKPLGLEVSWLKTKVQNEENKHLQPNHLARMVARLGPAMDQLVQLPHSSARTLLGAGSQSLLRTQDDLWKSYSTVSSVVARPRGRAAIDPVRLRGLPCLVHSLMGREVGATLRRSHVLTNKFFSRTQLCLRSIGHLSAVYCMLFDRTGKYVFPQSKDGTGWQSFHFHSLDDI